MSYLHLKVILMVNNQIRVKKKTISLLAAVNAENPSEQNQTKTFTLILTRVLLCSRAIISLF